MQLHTTAPAPLLILVGVAFIAGACVLAWLSSPFTLKASRTAPSTANVVIEDRLFAVFPIGREKYEGVRGARYIVPHPEGSTSRASTTRFLVLDTSRGQVFVGPSHHVLGVRADDIRDFLADPSRAELVLHKLDIGGETVRFVAAQAGVLFLALVGAFVAWLGLRAMFPDPNAGIGPV